MAICKIGDIEFTNIKFYDFNQRKNNFEKKSFIFNIEYEDDLEFKEYIENFDMKHKKDFIITEDNGNVFNFYGCFPIVVISEKNICGISMDHYEIDFSDDCEDDSQFEDDFEE